MSYTVHTIRVEHDNRASRELICPGDADMCRAILSIYPKGMKYYFLF